jgi:Uma2 family endonuclease
MTIPQILAQAIEYPESDGQPMAETGIHVLRMTEALLTLREFFRNRPDVYVAANMFMYYEEGDPKKVVAPDLYIALDVAWQGERRTWKVWEEGKAPDAIFEFTSASSRREDLGTKKGLYEVLGVREYFIYDPLGEYLKPPLRGYRREGEEFVRLIGTPIESVALGLDLVVEQGILRFYDRATGEKLLTPLEQAEARRVEAEARRAAEARAAAAEAELARLQAELTALRSGR